MPRPPEAGILLADIERVREGDIDRDHEYKQNAASKDQPIQRKPLSSTFATHPGLGPERFSKHMNVSESESGFKSSQDAPSPTQQSHDGGVWSPGVWKQFPFEGIASLLGCLACIIASIVVLVKSDGQPTSSWTVSPSVYIALLMTATNFFAQFAFGEGVKIAWWCKALRGGTIADLHNQWTHASGFLPALFSGRQFGLVALASIAVNAMAVNQPLIQRASTVISITKTLPVQITAPIAPELPEGYTGYQNGRGYLSQVMTQPMISVFNDYNSRAPIIPGFSGCNGTCTGYVEAGGLSAKCNTTSGPVMYSSLNLIDDVGKPMSAFSVELDLTPSNAISSQIVVNIAFTNNSNRVSCSGIRTERTCYLTPATLRYPVKLTGDTLEIGDVLNSGTTLSFTPRTSQSIVDGGGDFSSWTLGGMYLAANSLFTSNATYTFGGGIGYFMDLPDTLSNQFLDLTSSQNLSSSQGRQALTRPVACQTNWTDPTPYIISSMNAMAFRVSLSGANYPFRNTSIPPTPQLLTMEQTSTINVFHSEYRFLIASTVLTTVFIIFIIPTFIGWWELGRPVTLNPMETAKAFDAPLLHGPGSNAPLSGLIKSVGGRQLQLGEVESYAAGSTASRQLKLADPVEVTTPKPGVAYA